MNYNDLGKLKQATVEFVNFEEWENPIALTLTFKKCIWPEPYLRLSIDQYAAEQNLRHFLNVLNGKLLSRPERRNGERIGTFAVYEKDKNDRPHCHAMIECPNPEMIERLPDLVSRHWPTTNWGYKDTKVIPCYDAGWVDYCSKFRTKNAYDEAHDWLAYTPPTKKVS